MRRRLRIVVVAVLVAATQLVVLASPVVANAQTSTEADVTDGLPTPIYNEPEVSDPGSGVGVYVTSNLVLKGSAYDDGAVAQVVIGIKNPRTGLWLQADGTFGPKVKKFRADLGDPGASETSWRFAVTLPDGRYALSVRAFDDEGNSDSLKPRRRFKVDTTGPVIEAAFPFGATLLGPDVVLNGRVKDGQTLVFEAKVAVKDRSTGLWLQPDGTFGPRHRKMEAGLFTCRPSKGPFCLPGTPNGGDEKISAWFYEASLPAGDYSLSVRAWDAFGNTSSVHPWRHFTVDPSIDTLPVPMSDVAAGDVLTTSPVMLTGDATDDIGIARVRVGIKDRDTGLWWTGFGFSDRIERFDAVVDDLGEATTSWHVETALPEGRYALSVRAFDVQGYSASISPWVKFTVDTS